MYAYVGSDVVYSTYARSRRGAAILPGNLHCAGGLRCYTGGPRRNVVASQAPLTAVVVAMMPSGANRKLLKVAGIAATGCETNAPLSMLAGSKSQRQAEMALRGQQLIEAELTAEPPATAVLMACVRKQEASFAALPCLYRTVPYRTVLAKSGRRLGKSYYNLQIKVMPVSLT